MRPGIAWIAAVLVLVAAGCASGGQEGPASPEGTATAVAETGTPDAGDGTPGGQEGSPTADGSAEETPAVGASLIDGVVAYVLEMGLDNETFEVSDPINCNAFIDAETIEDAAGMVCINFGNAEFTNTDGVIEVRVVDTERTWELTLQLREFAWVVTEVRRTGE